MHRTDQASKQASKRALARALALQPVQLKPASKQATRT
jgi:hypothetical protein